MIVTEYKPEKCTHLCYVNGYRIFENPDHGDMAPILVEIDDRLVELDVYDVDDVDEVTAQIERAVVRSNS